MIGEDISVCVCLAILISLFNEEGTAFCIFFGLLVPQCIKRIMMLRYLNHLQGPLMVENVLK